MHGRYPVRPKRLTAHLPQPLLPGQLRVAEQYGREFGNLAKGDDSARIAGRSVRGLPFDASAS